MAAAHFSGPVHSAGGFVGNITGDILSPAFLYTALAVNATTTLTGAQAVSGYITVASATAVTLTMPTGTDLGAVLGASKGTVFDLYFDNIASTSSGTLTIAVNTNAILSAAAAAGTGAGAGLLTVPIGVTGQACFRLMFSSATAYTFSRIA